MLSKLNYPTLRSLQRLRLSYPMVSGHLCWVRNKPIPRSSCVDECSSSPVPDDDSTYYVKILIDLTISLIVGKYMCASSLNCVRFFATPWTVACQALLSMELSRQEYGNGLAVPALGDLPDPRIEPMSPASPALAGRFFTTDPPGNTRAQYFRHSPTLNTQSTWV